jgi:hypothetical protein
MDNNTSLYQQTLNALQERRTKCLEEVQKLDSAISALSATMTAAPPIWSPPQPPPFHIAKPSDHQKRYSYMSVRWAILKFFAEGMIGYGRGQAATSADISAELLSGGNERASKPTVSAVVSDMVNKRNELQTTDSGGFMLTDNGKAAWAAIRQSARYENRASSAVEQ